jgi:ABC-type lipoprotein export system ATPase subunit
MIEIKDVTKLYPSQGAGQESANGKESQSAAIHALDHISLRVGQGEWLSIMGPSGSGKSTLVNLIGCLDRPTSGEIWLDGQNVGGENRIHFSAVSPHSLSHSSRERHAGAVFSQHDRRE